MDIIRFGSLIEVFEGESVLRVPAPIETSPTIDIHFVFAKNVHHVYSICPTDGTHILEDLTQYCSVTNRFPFHRIDLFGCQFFIHTLV